MAFTVRSGNTVLILLLKTKAHLRRPSPSRPSPLWPSRVPNGCDRRSERCGGDVTESRQRRTGEHFLRLDPPLGQMRDSPAGRCEICPMRLSPSISLFISFRILCCASAVRRHPETAARALDNGVHPTAYQRSPCRGTRSLIG